MALITVYDGNDKSGGKTVFRVQSMAPFVDETGKLRKEFNNNAQALLNHALASSCEVSVSTFSALEGGLVLNDRNGQAAERKFDKEGTLIIEGRYKDGVKQSYRGPSSNLGQTYVDGKLVLTDGQKREMLRLDYEKELRRIKRDCSAPRIFRF